MESYFINQGYLLPEFHLRYWLGLYIPMRDPKLWPRFLWLDGSPEPSNPAEPNVNYAHWGVTYLADGTRLDEPSNRLRPQFCVTANCTQQFDGAWGWSDENCDDRYMFICKVPAPPPPSPPLPPPVPPPPAPPLATMYISNASRTTYYFQTKLRNHWDATVFCTGLRGRLATWTSLARQQEVERAFAQRNVLDKQVPFYWLGLQVNGQDVWPRFTWTISGLTPKQAGYEHWGTWMPGRHLEPNNVYPAEDCAGANATEIYSGAWGWADINCYAEGHSICEVPFPAPPPPSPSPPFRPLSALPSYTNAKGASPSSTYYWNPDAYTYGDASGLCSMLGGWLVSYSSLKEQMEVRLELSAVAPVQAAALLAHDSLESSSLTRRAACYAGRGGICSARLGAAAHAQLLDWPAGGARDP